MGVFDFFRRKPPKAPTPARPETEGEAIRRREARMAEVRKGIGRSVLPRGEVSGEEHFGGRGGGRPASGRAKRGHGYRSRLTGNVVHVDAAFDPDEHAAFLLGIKVECRSSWVEAARWNEETSTLTLWAGGKGYDFPGMDLTAAAVFSSHMSKGRWFHEVWKGQYYRGVGEFPLLDQMPTPRR